MRAVLLLFVIFFFSAQSWAFWVDNVVKRFSPVEAKVIAVEGKRVFVDSGRKLGVKKHDVFAIYRPVKVLKSATGKPITIWSPPLAFAEVETVEENYSVLRVSSLKVKPKEGWKAVRFDNVPVCFVGEGDKSDIVARMLKISLSNLSWVSDCSKAKLIFKYTKQGYLDVVNSRRIEIAFLPIFQVEFPKPAPPSPKKKRYTKGGSSIYMENYRDVAALPVYVLSADFGTVEGEGGVKLPAVVYTNGKSIFFAIVVDYEPKVISRYDYGGVGDVIHVSVGDADGDGGMEVVATAYDMDKGPVSFILKIDENGKMKLFKDGIYYILTMEDADLDGTKETILGTDFSDEDFFEKKLYVMKLEGEKLKKLEKISVPDVFKLYSCYYGDINGDGDKEVVFTTDTHKLAVYSNGDMWLSSESVGGGYNYVRIVKGGPSMNYEEAIYVDPNLVVFKMGKKPVVFAIKNKSKHKFIVGNVPIYSGSEILQLVEEFYGYSLVIVSEEVDGVIQAAGVVGKELWCIMNVEPPFKRNARSYIIAYPLPE